MDTQEYGVQYSKRRTISLILRRDGTLLVRAPIGTPKSHIDSVVQKHHRWLENAKERQRKRCESEAVLDEQEIRRLKESAKTYFSEKIEYFSKIMGLKYGSIKITSAKTRFGSCNSKGNICFSYRLMLYPEAAREYVVVHELAHLCEMNHGPRFYKIIESTLPDYKERRRLLK